jgi:hypothetical protein
MGREERFPLCNREDTEGVVTMNLYDETDLKYESKRQYQYGLSDGIYIGMLLTSISVGITLGMLCYWGILVIE